MKTYNVKIKGASAMLQNRLGKDLLDEISKVRKDDLPQWEEDNWQKKAYTNKEGEPILPELLIHAFLIESAKKHTVRPPKAIGRTWTNYIKSSILIPENAQLQNVTIEPFGTMVNGNPSSNKKGSKVYKIRPKINPGWTATFKILDLVGNLNAETIEQILDTGGKFVGLCDWRPLYGRFSVVSVKEE